MGLNTTLKLSLFSLVVSNMLYANETTKKLDKVMVTANKIEENIQEVPQSITVIDGVILEEKGIKNIEGIIKEIPNMHIMPDHGSAVNFRGLNASMFTNNNPIVIYIDGVPTSDRYLFDSSLENVERVEVLRGPQGTLYGKDAIGGVINIVTKTPTNETTGSIGFEYGSWNSIRGTLNLNTPIINDKLFFNLSADIDNKDDWITNTYYNDDEASKNESSKYSTSLFYKATDKLSMKLVLKREDEKNYWENSHGILGSVTSLNGFSRDSAENVSFDVPTLEDLDINIQSFNVIYDADNYTLQSVTTHKDSKLYGTYEGDFSSGTPYDGSTMFNNTDTDEYTQELRISNKQSEGIRWVAGVYLDTHERKQGPYGQDFKYMGMDYMYGNAMSTSDSDTKAIFAQAMIPLSKDFELTLGGRYQKIKKNIDITMQNYMMGMGSYTFDLDAEKTWNVFIPKVALAYKANENFTPYISISKGYMPGGFNYYASSAVVEENTFEPQISTNYEAGIKGKIGNLNYTASIFRMNIDDIHVFKIVANQYITDNAEKAHSQGIEFDFTYFPNETLEISGSLGLIDAEYDAYNTGTADFSGKEIENTPSHTLSLGIAYYDPQGYYARTDIKSVGDVAFYGNNTYVKEDNYTTVDLKLGYRFNNWDVYAYAKNLTDKEYIQAYRANSMFAVAGFGDPRSFGVGLKYKF